MTNKSPSIFLCTLQYVEFLSAPKSQTFLVASKFKSLIKSNMLFTFAGLVNLKQLDLGFNNISEIEKDAFKYLKNLEVITLRRNRLTVLSDWTRPLLNLKTLDISQNLLVQLASEVSLHNVEVFIFD